MYKTGHAFTCLVLEELLMT